MNLERMDNEDREALEMILERHGWNLTRAVIDDICKKRRIAFWISEGMSPVNAEQYHEELFPTATS